MKIYHTVATYIMVEHKYFASYRSLGRVKLRCVLLEKRGLVRSLILLTLRRVGCRNQLPEAEGLKVLCEIKCEVTPFGVITRQQHSLAPKHIRIVFKVGVDFALNVVILSVKLVVFAAFAAESDSLAMVYADAIGFRSDCE